MGMGFDLTTENFKEFLPSKSIENRLKIKNKK